MLGRPRGMVLLLALAAGCDNRTTLVPDGGVSGDSGVRLPDGLGGEAGRSDAGTLDRGASRDGAASQDGALPAGFVPQPQNLPAGYLCTIAADYLAKGGDPARPPCEVEADTLSDADPRVAPSALKVVTWNVEYGKKSDEVLKALRDEVALKGAHVIFLQESPRNDLASVPQKLNLARHLAQNLKLNYVFAVEWDRRLKATEGGEHGVAILSKYPIGNVTQLRHAPLFDYWKDRQDYGGRITLGADLAIGGKRLRAYSAHFCHRDLTGNGRAAQGAEVRADATQPGRPALQLLGGDFNTFTCNPAIAACNKAPAAEKVIEDLFAAGWADLLPTFNSWTELGYGVVGQRLDWLFGKGLTPAAHQVLQSLKASDHVPLMATVPMP
ncbi:MAG: endonuclease/exonuclease/phosphatase family protein [Deltaproteobacteria bacterium]|nr:endonuclease/exonuclease/phosphatase family protein [Deltaproteobacteria bacterium]